MSRKTGEIAWILGDPAGYSERLRKLVLKPAPGTPYPYYGHSPVLTAQGTLLFFDNAVYGTMPFTKTVPPGKVRSRAVEYAIDEKAGTFRQVWASDAGAPMLAMDMGGAYMLPEMDHVLVCYGSATPRPSADDTWDTLTDKTRFTAVREYTHATPTKIVWELLVRSDDPSAGGWAAYRAERWPLR